MGLTKLGWNAAREAQFAPHHAMGLIPARVAVEDKHFYRIWTAEAELTAQITGKGTASGVILQEIYEVP